ncbi:MAG: glycosyltransferase [Bacteroidales bacterium]|nr:glycosyltransferase [Candidatus Physcocola equi]
MTNILFITYGLEKNGTEEFIMNVLRGLNKEKFHADFLIFSQGETSNSIEAESYGCKIFRLPPRRKGLCYYKELDDFFMKNAAYYNAVHLNEGNMTTISPIYYAWKYKVPVRIIHAHNSNTPGFLNKLQHWYNKQFNLKYCTHRFACSTLASEFFFDGKNSTIIKNGIVLNRFSYNTTERTKFRAQLGFSETEKIIGHVGRFTDVKNQNFIVDIFNKYHQMNPDSRLVLIGVGVNYDKIKQKVKKLNIDDSVLMPGLQTNINEWMQAFDLFLMPSLFEGLPFVLVEAQAAGLPCVVANTINKDAAITDSFYYLRLSDSAQIWADKINSILMNYKRENKDEIIEKTGFSIENTVYYLQEVYEKG